jgi:ABC-type antimicrobial peptide transport system permease subunit
MPTWIPARAVIDYLTGASLVVAGVCFLLARKTRMAATYLGAWIVLLVVVIYGPVLIGALADPRTGVKVEGLNYFADTLLFGAVILSLARARPSALSNIQQN